MGECGITKIIKKKKARTHSDGDTGEGMNNVALEGRREGMTSQGDEPEHER